MTKESTHIIDKRNSHLGKRTNILTEVKGTLVALYYIGAEEPKPYSIKHHNGIPGYRYKTAVFLTDDPDKVINNMHVDLEKVPKYKWEVELPLHIFRGLGGMKKNPQGERQMPVPIECWDDVSIKKLERVYKKIAKMFSKMGFTERLQLINSLQYQGDKIEKTDPRRAAYVRYVVKRLRKQDSKDRFDEAQEREDKETEVRKEREERFHSKDK